MNTLDYTKVTLPEGINAHKDVPTNHPYWLYGHYQDYHKRQVRRMLTNFGDSIDENGRINERLFKMFFGQDSPEFVLHQIDKLIEELEAFTLKYPDAVFNYGEDNRKKYKELLAR